MSQLPSQIATVEQLNRSQTPPPNEAAMRAWQRDHAFAADSPSLMDIWNAANVDTITATFYRHALRAGIAWDEPGFALTPKSVEQLGSGIDKDLWPAFEEATSTGQAQLIRMELLDKMQARHTLARAGFLGTAASLLENIADPPTLAASALTGGAGGAIRIGSAAGRVGAMARAGMIAGDVAIAGAKTAAPFAALEAYRVSQDPTATASDVVAAGVAGVGQGVGGYFGRSAGRLARAAIEGTSAGVGQAFGYGAQHIVDPSKDFHSDDVLYGIALQAGLGAVGGAFHNPERTALADTLRKDIEYRQALDAGATMTEKGKSVYAEQVKLPERVGAAVDGLLFHADEARGELHADTEARMTELLAADEAKRVEFARRQAELESLPETAMGAAAMRELDPGKGVHPPPVEKRAGDFNFEGATDSDIRVGGGIESNFGRSTVKIPIRFADAIAYMRSGSKKLIEKANSLFHDPLRKKDGPAFYSAEDAKHDRIESQASWLLTANNAAYGEYRKAAKAAREPVLSRSQFMEQVGLWSRRTDAEPTNPQIRRVIENIRKSNSEQLDFVQHHDDRFAEIPTDPKYLTRLPVAAKIESIIAQNGLKAAHEVVMRGLLEGTPDLTPELALKWAKLWVKLHTDFPGVNAARKARFFDSDQLDLVQEVLASAQRSDPAEFGGVTIKDLLGPSATSGLPARARARMTISEQAEANGIKFTDFLENNAEIVALKYIHDMTAHAAVAELGRVNSPSPDRRLYTVEQILNQWTEQAQNDARASMPKDATELDSARHLSKFKADVSLLEYGLRRLNNEPVAGTGTGAAADFNRTARRAARVVNNTMTAKVMADIGSGINNLSEMSDIVAAHGLKAVWKQAPAAFDAFKRLANGTASNEMVRHLEAIGVAVENYTHVPIPGIGDTLDGQIVSGPEYTTQKWAHFAWKHSFQERVQRFEGVIAGASMIQSMYDKAASGGTFDKRHLADVGLHPEDWNVIAIQLKKHAILKEGRTDVVADPNVRDWTDDYAKAKFNQAVAIGTRKIVYSNSALGAAPWMSSTVAIPFLSLKRYMVGTWSNKVVRSADLGAKRFTASIGYALGVGALTYAAATAYRSIGKVDDKEYRRKMLTPEKIIANGWSRSSMASWLPMAFDQVHMFFGGEPEFSYAKTSGLHGGAIASTPAVRMFSDAYNTFEHPQTIFTEQPFWTKKRAQALKSLVIPRLYKAHEIFDQLTKGLPQHDYVR